MAVVNGMTRNKGDGRMGRRLDQGPFAPLGEEGKTRIRADNLAASRPDPVRLPMPGVPTMCAAQGTRKNFFSATG